TIVLTHANGFDPPCDGHDGDRHHDDHDDDLDDPLARDQVVSGNDTLFGGGSTDVLVGDSVEVGAVFVMAGGGASSEEFYGAKDDARDLAEEMASLVTAAQDDGGSDQFQPSNHGSGSVIFKGDGDDLFSSGDAKKLLVNWSASFDGFGSAQGVGFPTTW